MEDAPAFKYTHIQTTGYIQWGQDQVEGRLSSMVLASPNLNFNKQN